MRIRPNYGGGCLRRPDLYTQQQASQSELRNWTTEHSFTTPIVN